MHIAFRRDPYAWVIYCYRGSRYAYDSKWQPRKPNTSNGSLGKTLDEWKEDESDQVSYCSFGDHHDKWFMRSTNATTEWLTECGPGVTYQLKKHLYQYTLESKEKKRINKDLKPAKVSTIRAATFGPSGAWILYTQNEFVWSEEGLLPSSLLQALLLGKQSRPKWIINVSGLESQRRIAKLSRRQKAVLNPFNGHEYVLVYDNGNIYCSFHHDFFDSFAIVIKEWAYSMTDNERWLLGEEARVYYLDPHEVARGAKHDNYLAVPEDEFYDVIDDNSHVHVPLHVELEAPRQAEPRQLADSGASVVSGQNEDHDRMQEPTNVRQHRSISYDSEDMRNPSSSTNQGRPWYRHRPSMRSDNSIHAFQQHELNARRKQNGRTDTNSTYESSRGKPSHFSSITFLAAA